MICYISAVWWTTTLETERHISPITREFTVNVGLRQENALCPLLFIAVVEVIRRKTSADLLRKLLYVDNLAVEVDMEADRQDRLVEWKEIKADMD